MFKNQVGITEPTVIVQYLYDSSGNRVKKIVRKQGGNYEIRTYIDGVFEHFTDEVAEQNTIQIMDDQSRVANVRMGDAMGDSTPAIKYNLENNIYSSAVILDNNGTIVNTQEYYPFGETSFGSYGKKRYQYVGKERDEESGLYYYGARYYAPWTCRFISCDPKAAETPQQSPYNYCHNNPVNLIDPDGMQATGTDDPPTDTGSKQVNGIKATPEGAGIYMKGFEKTLGDINPFSYDQEKGSVIYDSNKLEAAKNIATCEQLEIIDSAVLLIDNGESTINIVDWNETLPHREKSNEKSLKEAGRAGETVTKMNGDGKFLGADIYVARNTQVPTGEQNYIGAKYDQYGNMTSYQKAENVMRNLTADEISIAALHELGHPNFRVTRPELNSDPNSIEHNKLVEGFENRMRAIYQTGTKEMSTRVKGFGKIRYSVPTYMGGKALPH